MEISVLVGLVIIVAVVAAIYLLRKRREAKPSFDEFLRAAVSAADECERTYTAIVSAESMEPSARGLIMARFAGALFPISAVAVLEANGLLPDHFKQQSISGKNIWNLASGIAVEPIAEKGYEIDYEVIKIDQRVAVDTFIELFNSSKMHEGVPFVIQKLSPIWRQAIIADNPSLEEVYGLHNLIYDQYVAGGMNLFMQLYTAISGRKF